MKIKYKKALMLLSISLVFGHASQAQFLKRLKNKVEQKVENVVIDKTADKAAAKTSKAMDKALDGSPFGDMGKVEKKSSEILPSNYAFSYRYALQMKTKEGQMTFDYYLMPDVSYFGFTQEQMPDMFTVMDPKQELMAIFMNSGGQNMGTVQSLPINFKEEAKSDNAFNEKMNYRTLPDKTINGFYCKGVEAKNEEMTIVLYFTTDTKVSFDDIFKTSRGAVPKELMSYFDPNQKSLVIYMEVENHKNNKQNMKMECIALEKTDKKIRKSDYKFM